MVTKRRKPNSSDRLLKAHLSLYLEPTQAQALKALSTRTRVPQQAYLREGLDLVLERYAAKGAR
jgi:hypothetical protein